MSLVTCRFRSGERSFRLAAPTRGADWIHGTRREASSCTRDTPTPCVQPRRRRSGRSRDTENEAGKKGVVHPCSHHTCPASLRPSATRTTLSAHARTRERFAHGRSPPRFAGEIPRQAGLRKPSPPASSSDCGGREIRAASPGQTPNRPSAIAPPGRGGFAFIQPELASGRQSNRGT